MADHQPPTKTATRVIAASSVTGTVVYAKDGEKLGTVYDVILNETTGKIEYFIMNFGGLFVGINQRFYPLPWHLLDFDENYDGYVIAIDRQKLDDAPTYESPDKAVSWDHDLGSRVNAYYGAASIYTNSPND